MAAAAILDLDIWPYLCC